MPELPEVETTCRGVLPYALDQKFTNVVVRQHQLRWRVPANLNKILSGQSIQGISRRAKYILVSCSLGTLIIHLGMSGKLSVVSKGTLAAKHDHLDFALSNNVVLRYTDPRRFGSINWTTEPANQHKLLAHLGVEPLSTDFSGQYLLTAVEKKKTPIKSLLMDASIVVGVGNIYANEALFFAKINPTRSALTLDLAECVSLVKHIKRILQKSIKKGGTTLKDFFNADGKPGYFSQELMVYGRIGGNCYVCNSKLTSLRLNQRTTVYCPSCQN